MVSSKNSKIVSFGFLVIKNIVVFPARYKFPSKSISWVAFGSACSACCLLKPIALVL